MRKYHPSKTPSPEEWLELDEGERLYLVQKYHIDSGVEFDDEGAEQIHSVIHTIIENQLAMRVVPVPATIAKLTTQGLSRHEAIHAVGAILSEDLFGIINNNQEQDVAKFNKRLNKLTAKRWRKGKW